MSRLGPRACWVCAALLVFGAQLLKGPHHQHPRTEPSSHGPPRQVTPGVPASAAEPPRGRAVSPAATATPGTTHAKCGGGITFESLQLNQVAQELWGCWGNRSDSGVAAVMLTFGSHSMADFLLNWLEHVKRLGQRLYLVGALDQRMEQLCALHGIPAATIKPSAMAANGILSSVGQLSKSSGQYYRYAAGTFLKMGLVKEVFIRSMLDAGLDAMVSDVDVAWLSSPWPLVRYPEAVARPSAALLALADVILSVDQVQQYMDSDKYQWHIHSELNTGVIFFRNSDGARAVLEEWREAMAAAIAKGDPNHDQYWLNGVLRPRTFRNLKEDGKARARWYPALLEQLSKRRRVGASGAGRLPRGAEEFDARSTALRPNSEEYAALRPIFEFKDKLFGKDKVAPTVGTFPIAEISNGHTFFIQKMHEIVAVPPVAVHCTYQYGDDTGYAYGKRQRLRDAGLWLVDPPSYYEEGRYLQLVSGLAVQHSPTTATLLDPEVQDATHCVRSHLKLTSLQRQLLHDGFVLAKATRRTLILPPIWCNLDRFWTIMDHCLIGKRVEMPLPFICPLDHSFMLPNFFSANLDFREHTFLANPRVPAALRASRVRLRVGLGEAEAEAGAVVGAAFTMAEAEVAAAAASVAVCPKAAAATAAGMAPQGDAEVAAAAAAAVVAAAAASATAGGAARVAAGADFSQVVATMSMPAMTEARIIQLHVTDMRKLCRCTAGLPKEALELALKLKAALGSGYHYCDTTDNPFFVECKQGATKERGQGCRKHPMYLMNVSRGTQPAMGAEAQQCGAAHPQRTCAKYVLPDEHISQGVRTAQTVRS